MKTKIHNVNDVQLLMFKDLVSSYLLMLNLIKEEDETFDQLRQARISDCEAALETIAQIEKK